MAPSFSSYLTLLTSAFAKVDAMLPRIKPKSNLPKTITKLARTIRRREHQCARTWYIPYFWIRRPGRWLFFFVLRVPVIRGGRLFQPGRSLNFPYSQQVVLVNFPTNMKSLFLKKNLRTPRGSLIAVPCQFLCHCFTSKITKQTTLWCYLVDVSQRNVCKWFGRREADRAVKKW